MKIYMEIFGVLVDIRRLIFSNIFKEEDLTNDKVLKELDTFRIYDLLCEKSYKRFKTELDVLCSVHPASKIKQVKNFLKTIPEKELKRSMQFLPHTNLKKYNFERMKKTLTQISNDNPFFYKELKEAPTLEIITNRLIAKYNLTKNQNE